MKQMRAPNVPAITRIPHGTIANGFFRQGNLGKIYLGFSRHGRDGPTYTFPVLADGSISKYGGGTEGENFWPDQKVDMIHPASLGIKDLVWSDEQATAQ